MAISMGSKLGTKISNENSFVEKDNSPAPNMTLEDRQRLGTDDLSAILNKAADKNWVEPSRKVVGHGNNQMDKDAFFKLMMAQLKNQDPMNPMQNHEMAAQLAQFSTLEQMSNMNSTLTKIEGKSSQPENFQALNMIGRTIEGDSSRVSRSQFDKEHDFNFILPQDASQATVHVMNGKGESVREYKLSDLKQGANKITWNGKNNDGTEMKAGEYFFRVQAVNMMGNNLPINTHFKGEVTGVGFSPEGLVLQVGKQSIKMKDVRQITDSSAKNNDQNVRNVTGLDLKNTNEAQQNRVKKEADVSPSANAPTEGNVLTDLAMSSELMEQIQKVVK